MSSNNDNNNCSKNDNYHNNSSIEVSEIIRSVDVDHISSSVDEISGNF